VHAIFVYITDIARYPEVFELGVRTAKSTTKLRRQRIWELSTQVSPAARMCIEELYDLLKVVDMYGLILKVAHRSQENKNSQ